MASPRSAYALCAQSSIRSTEGPLLQRRLQRLPAASTCSSSSPTTFLRSRGNREGEPSEPSTEKQTRDARRLARLFFACNQTEGVFSVFSGRSQCRGHVPRGLARAVRDAV